MRSPSPSNKFFSRRALRGKRFFYGGLNPQTPAASRRALRGNNKKQRAHDFGLKAEKIAAWCLRAKGYRILALRYRNHAGEIDLVARRGNWLVAVEVKARKTFGQCEISVPPAKQAKIARAMEGLIAGHGKIAGLGKPSERNIRFDVVWVVRGFWPRHVKDAWR